MAGEKSTTSAGMQAAGQRFVQGFDNVVARRKRLETDIQTMRASWDAQSARIFDGAMNDWGVAFNKLVTHLDEMADLLLGGAGHVEKAEDFSKTTASFFNA